LQRIANENEIMATCEHYHELLWDHLYGLLDAAEAQDLTAHLETCASCREALADAQRQQQLLARAARVVQDVPVFVPPGYEVEEPAAASVSAAITAEATSGLRTSSTNSPCEATPSAMRVHATHGGGY